MSHICVDQICFLFINSKGSVLSPADVRLVVTNYVKSHELMSAESKRYLDTCSKLGKHRVFFFNEIVTSSSLVLKACL